MENMMNKIKSLEIKRLFKELDYIESDFEYRSEVISEADTEFIRCVGEFLSKHPELKDLYDKKITQSINETIKKRAEENKESGSEDDTETIREDVSDNIHDDERVNEDTKEEEDNREFISPRLKKLYREIVKLTHPDIVKKKHLNEMYIEATIYYDNNDKIGIYKICSQLEIEYEIEEEDEGFISSKISQLKNKIGFLESTFTWKWYKTEGEDEKNKILIDYIKLKLQ
jgi:hypothetical protein